MILRAAIATAIGACALATASVAYARANPAASGPAAALLDRQIVPRQAGAMAPRDDCAAERGARTFRLSLARAVTSRDVEALVALASPQVQLGFGGDNGTAWLRRNAREGRGAFWANLADALALGCARFGDGSIAMPWIHAQDTGGLDPFDAIMVRGPRAPLRAAPSAAAPVLRMLDWQLVEFVGPWQADAKFVKVRTADKLEGFLPMSAQRGITETRIIAEPSKAGWRITAIVAGD